MEVTAIAREGATRGVERQDQARKRAIAQVNAASRGFSRNCRQKTMTRVMKLARLVKLATNDRDTLSARLGFALRLRRVAAALSPEDAVRVMTEEHYLVVKLADALLHTAYFPLQQLFFMALSSVLCVLRRTDGERALAILQRFKESLKQLDSILLGVLPVDGTIESRNARLARKQVNVLNRRSNICRAYNVRKCWISSGDKSKLMPINVDEWVDFGDTVATFYHQQPRETILYNIPYSCIDSLEFDETNCMAYVFAKRISSLDGITLVVFAVVPAEFESFKAVLLMTSLESITTRSTPKPRQAEPERQESAQTAMRAAKSVNLSVPAKRLPSPPQKSIQKAMPQFNFGVEDSSASLPTGIGEYAMVQLNASMAGQPQSQTLTETTLQHANKQDEDARNDICYPNELVSDDIRAMHPSKPTVHSLGDDIQAALKKHLAHVEEQPASDSTVVFRASTEKLKAATSALTSASANICSSHLTWNQELRRIFGSQTSCDELQQKRLADISDAELATEMELAKLKAECIQNLKESMGYVEDIVQEEPKQHRAMALGTVVMIVVPWVLLLARLGMEKASIPPAP